MSEMNVSPTTNVDVDVLIVGAGPSGLVMANELRRRGIRTRIIERQMGPALTSRALVIHPRTLEIFAYMGVVTPVIERGVHALGATIYDRERVLARVDLQPGGLDTPYPYAIMIPQHETEQFLFDHLATTGDKIASPDSASPGVEFARELIGLRHEYDGTVVAEVASGDAQARTVEEIRATWLIGCDGAHSSVRHLSGIAFRGRTLTQEFLLADVDLDWQKTRETTHIWFHRDGILAAFPLPHNRQWRLLVDLATSVQQQTPVASLKLFQALMRERTGDVTTTVSNATWLSNFRINQRIVAHYRRDHVFLVGDAAHIHSPLGGQGMNTGIQDAYNLAWKLALVIEGKAHEQLLLNSYEQERRPVARTVVFGTELGTKIVVGEQPVLRWLRDEIVVRMLKSSVILRPLARRGLELDIHYRSSALTRNVRWFHRGPHSGQRALQAHLQRWPEQSMTSMFDLLHDSRSLLLLFKATSDTPHSQHNTDYAQIVQMADDVRERLAETVSVYIVVRGAEKLAGPVWDGPVLRDVQDEIYSLYHIKGDELCFIRPDGYIGLRGDLDEKLLWSYLKRLFNFSTPVTGDDKSFNRSPTARK